nr:hypothetical protein [Candidatus Sigynarchaeota archaeon]
MSYTSLIYKCMECNTTSYDDAFIKKCAKCSMDICVTCYKKHDHLCIWCFQHVPKEYLWMKRLAILAFIIAPIAVLMLPAPAPLVMLLQRSAGLVGFVILYIFLAWLILGIFQSIVIKRMAKAIPDDAEARDIEAAKQALASTAPSNAPERIPATNAGEDQPALPSAEPTLVPSPPASQELWTVDRPSSTNASASSTRVSPELEAIQGIPAVQVQDALAVQVQGLPVPDPLSTSKPNRAKPLAEPGMEASKKQQESIDWIEANLMKEINTDSEVSKPDSSEKQGQTPDENQVQARVESLQPSADAESRQPLHQEVFQDSDSSSTDKSVSLPTAKAEVDHGQEDELLVLDQIMVYPEEIKDSQPQEIHDQGIAFPTPQPSQPISDQGVTPVMVPTSPPVSNDQDKPEFTIPRFIQAGSNTSNSRSLSCINCRNHFMGTSSKINICPFCGYVVRD